MEDEHLQSVFKACLTLGVLQRPNEMTKTLGECCLQQIRFPQKLPVTEALRLAQSAREKKVQRKTVAENVTSLVQLWIFSFELKQLFEFAPE